MIKKVLLLLLLTIPCFGVEDSTPLVQIGPFGTLNNNDDPMIIANNMAQDLLNVQVTPNGMSVKKRKGLSLAYTLAVATAPVHGIYNFFDSSGNDVSLFFNDHHLTTSVNGAAATVLFSTGAVDATWQCTDSLGFAYCANSARNPMIKTNGVTAVPLVVADTGTMTTSTTQRLVTSGFSSALSQIDFSAANDFTNWTLGGFVTSPYNETINAPGSRITHITAACNGLMWFKDSSFGIILNPDDALNAQNVILAPEIGTLDNTSIQYPGGLQFRDQYGHIYNFDCAGVEKLTSDITPTINTSGHRASNSWAQSSQSDFSAGASSQVVTLSTTVSPGDVTVGTFTATDTTTADFNAGTTNNTTVASNSVSLATNNSGSLTNPDFESSFTGNWTSSGGLGFIPSASVTSHNCGVITPQTGSKYAQGTMSINSNTYAFEATDVSGTLLTSVSLSFLDNCVWTQSSLSPGTNTGKRVKFRFHGFDSNNGDTYLTTSDSYIWGGTVSFYYTTDRSFNNNSNIFAVDNVQNGSSTITTGSFTSKAFDTGLAFSTIYPTANWTANTSTPSFVLQKGSSTTGGWQDVGTSTGTNYSINKRYVRYISTFTITGTDSAISTLDDVTLLARSSGTYYSAVHNTPSLTSWDTLSVTKQDNGGSHSFYVRASTSVFTVLSATPSWTSVSAGGVISAATGTFVQVRDDFSVFTASDSPILNDFTVNWFEGTASDKAYGIFFGRDDALWWSTPVGSGQSTNNRILRWDIINHGWTLYDISANGFLIRNGSLYIGSSSEGKIYKFGDTDNDNGAAINSYWKSKDFPMDNPMVDKEIRTLSVIAKSVSASTMTVTYTLNASSSTAYSLYLYNSASSIMRNNRYLPAGRVGNTLNVQFGNNAADQYWELFGAAFKYVPKPWITGN